MFLATSALCTVLKYVYKAITAAAPGTNLTDCFKITLKVPKVNPFLRALATLLIPLIPSDYEKLFLAEATYFSF